MKKLTLFLAFLIFSASLFAQPIRELVFFGDSLTDNGNLYNKVGKLVPKSPPYYEGRFTNGLVWADYISSNFNEKYGAQAKNYALGGATVVSRSIFDGALPFYLKKEVNNYLSSQSKIDKEAVLYFIWMGANDYMDEKKQPINLLVKDVMDELTHQIRVLIENGGQNFVIIDLPDLSKAPFAKKISQEERDRLYKLSQLNHEKLLDTIYLLRKSYPVFHFIYVDGFAIFNDMYLNMQNYNQKYNKHIVNLTESCWLGGYRGVNVTYDAVLQESIQNSTSLSIANNVGMSQSLGETPCKSPDDYLFWDAVHPSVIIHEIFANIVSEAIERELHFK